MVQVPNAATNPKMCDWWADLRVTKRLISTVDGYVFLDMIRRRASFVKLETECA